MDRLLSLLLFAALFYLMIRFGCGAHVVHGSHDGHEHNDHHEDGKGSTKDPVCGMPIESGQACDVTDITFSDQWSPYTLRESRRGDG